MTEDGSTLLHHRTIFDGWRSLTVGIYMALAGYAVAFSFSYRGLSAATGALLLFGAVQITMLGVAGFRGERFGGLQLLGSVLAIGGLAYLLLPGVESPPLVSASLELLPTHR